MVRHLPFEYVGMNLKSFLLDFFFPPKCPFCGKVTAGHMVCPSCRKSLPWTEGRETRRDLAAGVPCAAPLWYEDDVREGILRYKFHGVIASAEVLGELIARCAAEEFSGEFDAVTWVPVGPKRLRKRGYDQTRLLAEAACRLWDTRPEAMLRKPLDNPPQSEQKDAAARRANVLGVYETVPGAAIAGRHILLVDDIVTTGATLLECVRVLKDAGAVSVKCVALAAARPARRPNSAKRDGTAQNAQNT